MSGVIDTRFLSVHPATVDWWVRRKKCSECANAQILPDVSSPAASASLVFRCGALLVVCGGNGFGRSINPYCIDARSDSGGCGPSAAMFVAKV